MTDRESMKMVLEDVCGAKLCEINSMSSRAEMLRLMDKAIEALRQALAQPEQKLNDPPAYVEPPTSDYHNGWEEGFEAAKNLFKKESAPQNADPRLLLVRKDNCIALAQPEQEQEQEPEIVRRVRRYAGKRRESVSSPHINAKECIALANWIESMLAQPEQEPVCDKDPFYCWSIRCQVGKVCKHTAQPKQESISTNDHLCAMLRQVHDVLACTALPMKRKWVGLTGLELNHIFAANVGYPERMCRAIESKLKEKNGG